MLRTLFLLTLICLSPVIGHADTADSRTGPKAYLPDQLFAFQPVVEGTDVVHEFVIFNQGDEPLNILKVKSG